MSGPDVATLVLAVDRARRQLYARLRSNDARVLSKRPAPDTWSILENVRHLLFAEQVHLGKFLPVGSAWNPMKLPRRGRAFTDKSVTVVIRRDGRQLVADYAGLEPKGELEVVLLAWDLIHRPLRTAVRAAGADAAYALERHLGHLQRHVDAIEKLLMKAEA